MLILPQPADILCGVPPLNPQPQIRQSARGRRLVQSA